MNTAGIIAEYNPFHNGHLYQLNEMRRLINPDVTVVVMSGDFLQRGEPAIVSKWDRTRMALLAGADLVIELPYLFSVARADIFARGAVDTLNHLGVNTLIFGSENGRIEPFFQTASLIEKNKTRYEQVLLDTLSKGISYPNAHAQAYRKLTSGSDAFVDLTQPNNSLGFQYVQAIRELGPDIQPVTIQRKESGHSDQTFTTEAQIASARSIRKHLFTISCMNGLQNKLPAHVYHALKLKKESGNLANWDAFFPFLKYRLLTSAPEELHQIYEVEEGIEYRLLKSINQAADFHSFITSVKTKRYTWARLQRLCVHILTNTSKAEAKQPAAEGKVPYLRLLGMSQNGQAYLSKIRKKRSIPLIAKIRKHRDPLLDLDIRAGRLYDYVTGNVSSGKQTETGHSPIRYNETDRSFSEE